MKRGLDIVMFLTNGLASDPRVEKEAAALIAAGHQVTVLAWDREGSLPRVEERAGMHIERLGPVSGHGRGVRSIPGFRTYWSAAARRAVELRPDVLHCHDLDTAVAGLRARKRLSRAGRSPRLVLDFHELYRESNMIPKGWAGRSVRLAVTLVERRSIPAADAVLVANPGSIGAYDRYASATAFHVIENAPDIDRFEPRGPLRKEPGEPLTVGFMGQKRYIDSLLDLIEVVGRDDRLRAILAGGGVGAAQVEGAAAGNDRIEVSGRFVYDELPGLYGRCDAIHAVYDTGLGNVRTLFPVKVMEAMASALPVIVAKGTWIAGYVEDHGIGYSVAPGTDELHRVLEDMLGDPARAAEMGARGRALIEAGLNWHAVADRLVDVYAGLGNSPSDRHG